MSIPRSTTRRIALLGFLLAGLVLLADWTARTELTWAVDATHGARVIARTAAAGG